MVCRKRVIVIAFLVLFTLMEQANPVAAGKKVKMLIKKVKELEERLAAIEKCKRKNVLF